MVRLRAQDFQLAKSASIDLQADLSLLGAEGEGIPQVKNAERQGVITEQLKGTMIKLLVQRNNLFHKSDCTQLPKEYNATLHTRAGQV